MDIPYYDKLEAFFREFHYALRNASLYPRSHPSFNKIIETLYQSFADVKPYYPTLFFAVLPTGILVNDTLLTEQQAPFYTEIAGFLHDRTIESLQFITTALTKSEFEQFIELLSRKNTDELRGLLGAYSSGSIRIKLLDFSEALKKEGEETGSGLPDWENRLKKLFAEKRTDEFKDVVENLLSETSENPEVDKALKTLETFFAEEKNQNLPFIKELIALVERTAENPSRMVHQKASQVFQRIIAQHAPSEAVSRLIATLVGLKQGPAMAIFKEINDRAGDERQERIARVATSLLKLQGVLLKDQNAVDSLQQLVSTRSAGKFANMMYAYALRYFTEMDSSGRLTSLQESIEKLTLPVIQRHYRSVLYDLLKKPAEKSALTDTAENVIKKELRRLIDEYLQKDQPEAAFSIPDTLKQINPDLGNNSLILEPLTWYLDRNSETLFSRDTERLLPFKETLMNIMEEKLPSRIRWLLEQYITEKDRERKDALAGFIVLLRKEETIEALARSARIADMERILEVINLLERISQPRCQDALIAIYRGSTAAMVKLTIIKAMRRNAALRSRKFLLVSLEEQKGPSLLRTEILNTLLVEQDGFINNKIVSFLLERMPGSAILFNSPVFSEALGFIRENGLKEGIPFLEAILKKQAFAFLFFAKPRKEILSVIAELKTRN